MECHGSPIHQSSRKTKLESNRRMNRPEVNRPNNSPKQLCSTMSYRAPPDPTLHFEDQCAHRLHRINSTSDQLTDLELSNEPLHNEQNKDPVVLTSKQLLQENTSFGPCVDEHGMGVVLLWSHATNLTIKNYILYRNFERPDGVMKYLQAVIPKSLRVEFLK